MDLNVNEAIVTLAFMFAWNAILGALFPRLGWFWPFLTLPGVPVVNLFPEWVRHAANPNVPRTVGSYAALTAMLFVAALTGMLFGVIVRRAAAVSKGPA